MAVALVVAMVSVENVSQAERVRVYTLCAEQEKFVYREIELYGRFAEYERAFIIYANLFDGSVVYIPPNVRLLDAIIRDAVLILNVSVEIMDGGGTVAEHALIDTILRNAWQIDGIEMVTLWIDGRLDYLPEGSMLFELRVERLADVSGSNFFVLECKFLL